MYVEPSVFHDCEVKAELAENTYCNGKQTEMEINEKRYTENFTNLPIFFFFITTISGFLRSLKNKKKLEFKKNSRGGKVRYSQVKLRKVGKTHCIVCEK